MNRPQVLPLLPLRGLTVFPHMTLHFDVSREMSVEALDAAMREDQLIFLVTQKDLRVETPRADDLYTVGTVARVRQVLKVSNDTVRALVEGVTRAVRGVMMETEPYLSCEAIPIDPAYMSDEVEEEATVRQLQNTFDAYFQRANLSEQLLISVKATDEVGELCDVIAANLSLRYQDKQQILETVDPRIRAEKTMVLLNRETRIMRLDRKIATRVQQQMEKNQKEYYLREQLRAIQLELDGAEGIGVTVNEYREKFKDRQLPKEVADKVERELSHLSRLQPTTPEAGVIMGYLDWVLDLPWETTTEECLDLNIAQAQLDADHYGLEKVKDRIIESLAARKHAGSANGDILCLVGPPGVGKSSIAESVARALNRSFVRVALGGVHDEAEIRGHRRTYIGALPGRIISAYKQAKTNNPLMLLDEIDKLASDYRGDPSSALLEVLDPNQQADFRDHYLDLPFDLSKTLFITTANTTDTIPKPLLDRMEVIRIEGYTPKEKEEIALRHLLPKIGQKLKVTQSLIRVPEETVRMVIEQYTREAGVRLLEQQLSKLVRKALRQIADGSKKRMTITPNNAQKLLGPPPCSPTLLPECDEVGVAVGLAWTAVGGETLTIEVNVMDGTGKVELTGSLGDVMKESASAAVSYIRAHAEELGIPADFYRTRDLHIHVPEGATPKDGPSAGITMATALASALSGRAVRRDVAMTGEITLRGRVLPIGGLKEKSLAAYMAGITTVIVPEQNKKDLQELPEVVRKNVRFVFADKVETVLKTALLPKSASGKQPISVKQSTFTALHQ